VDPRARIVLACCAALAGCTGSRAAPEATLVVGRPADAIGLDPARVTDADSSEVCEQIYDTLVREKRGTTEIEPALAERWEVNSAATEWIFHLRHGVRFHDGTPLDADAVLYNFERWRDPQHPRHRTDFVYYESAFRNLERVEKIDRYTVRMVIERPYAPFLANLSVFAMSIASPAAIAKYGDELAYHPVGTGPFRFVEWSRGDRITLAANRDYWGGPPKLTHLTFVAIRDARQRLVAIEGGAIDVAERLAPEDLQFVALHPELKIEQVAGNNVSYLGMNTEHPPFDDPRVRIAVAHAINKTPIVRMVFQGLAMPATGALVPSSWGYVDLQDYAYDPPLARKLLAEAGWRAERRFTLYVMSTPRPYLPSPEQVARMIARNLRDVGIDVELVVSPMADHLRRTSNGEHDLCVLGWQGDNGDPDNFLYGLFDSDNAQKGTARNVSFFRDAQLHGLLRWAQETTDHQQRVDFYAQAQRIIAEKAPWVPLAHAAIVVARRTHVHNLALQPSAKMLFHDVWVEPR
jgi:peptide/nickel transport system substrate-binding protein